MISIVLFVAFHALTLYASITQSMANKAMSWDLQIDLDDRQSRANGFADLVSRLPEVQRVAYDRCSHEEYIPPRSTITDAAHRALREVTGLRREHLPGAVDGGTYQFVLKVCAVGPAEFSRYAAQLGLDVQPYSDPSAPIGILINHTALRQGGKLYDFELFNLRPGDAMSASRMSVWSSPQAGDDAASSLTWTVGAVTRETPLGFLGVTLVPLMIVSDAVFDGLSDRMLQLGPIAPGHMTVKSDDPDAAVAAIKRLYATTVGGKLSYYSVEDFQRSQGLRSAMIALVCYEFLALITLIGVANMVTTLDSNIKLRRREIAMLRSVGLTPGGLLRMLCYESLCYGLTALLYGLPLGIALSVFIYYQFDGVSTFAFTLPWGAILACIAGILALVFATMMASGATIRSDNIVDTINQENL
jgi:putative ABC transport system permease protein